MKTVEFDAELDDILDIKYLIFKVDILENLINTCIVDNTDAINNIHIETILNNYVESNFEKQELMFSVMKKIVGEDLYNSIMKEQLYWEYNIFDNKLVINVPERM